MKPAHQRAHRFRWLSLRAVAIFLRKSFRPTQFAKYKIAPRLNVAAAERRILRKMRSPQEPTSANH